MLVEHFPTAWLSVFSWSVLDIVHVRQSFADRYDIAPLALLSPPWYVPMLDYNHRLKPSLSV
jgi:hypothetical protein